ncbi:5307_t:CDS:10 [Acaulospora colombiana]|uniref:5307_t:CDS:1 n=1 Tax=Acaulospora colombiana TaxID=27376 RepID=A0ACA9LM04_9GLOM|nr:5307_t:CDS:10 [Acaulospora colombiana]
MPDEKKLPWGINSTKPGSAKTLTKTKLQAFSIGTHKKTPFQKHKEELELKKKQESEEAAKVYAEFVASFEKEEGTGKAFVKGETIVPKLLFDHDAINIKKETTQPAAPPKIYKPQPFIPASKQTQPEPKASSTDENIDEDEDKREEKSRGKRNLDAFLEEIKREQEEREDRLRQKHAKLAGAGVLSDHVSKPPSTLWIDLDIGGNDEFLPTSLTVKAAFEDRPGSHDTGDPNTTNLYVGNISPEVNEEMLCKEFAKYGPIASVKIMWPRTQEEKDRNRNCGFVSFMDRECAALALKNMDGKELLGYVMRVGWGKAVPIPPQPIYVLKEGGRPPPSGLPFNAQMAKHRLEVMLRKLTFERGVIAKAMSFAIDHSDAADEIVDIICKALAIKETPIATKVARLYLVSDILHNSSVSIPNAWKFRTGFEGRLPEIFEHLNEVYRSITARLKAETFRPYIESLTNTFMKLTKEGDSTLNSISQSSSNDSNNGLDGTTTKSELENESPIQFQAGGLLGVKTKWDEEGEDENNNQKNISKDNSPSPAKRARFAVDYEMEQEMNITGIEKFGHGYDEIRKSKAESDVDDIFA